jgi:hypothetical protein
MVTTVTMAASTATAGIVAKFQRAALGRDISKAP